MVLDGLAVPPLGRLPLALLPVEVADLEDGLREARRRPLADARDLLGVLAGRVLRLEPLELTETPPRVGLIALGDEGRELEEALRRAEHDVVDLRVPRVQALELTIGVHRVRVGRLLVQAVRDLQLGQHGVLVEGEVVADLLEAQNRVVPQAPLHLAEPLLVEALRRLDDARSRGTGHALSILRGGDRGHGHPQREAHGDEGGVGARIGAGC